MAKFRCTSLPGGHTPPAHTGSGIRAPEDWILTDEPSVRGDVLKIDLASLPAPVPGHEITNCEIAIADRNGALSTRRVLGGPAVNYARRFLVETPQNAQRVQLRSEQRKVNQIGWADWGGSYTPSNGNSVKQPSTGASASISGVSSNGDGTFTLTLTDISGTFADTETTILKNSKSGTQISSSGSQIIWEPVPSYVPQAGDVATQASTGASATITHVSNAGAFRYIVLDDVSGNWTHQEIVTITGPNAPSPNGATGAQGTDLHVPHTAAHRTILHSEWSLPRDITPATGTPSVTVTASKTDILQGQAVMLEAFPTGFACERPMHDLHYRFHCDVPGEAGAYAALPAFFESAFGPGSNNRAEGYSSIWAFAPQTTGTVRVHCTVTDRDGTAQTGFVDLNVTAPAEDFAEADIYAASAALTAVPGAPGARVFADIDAALAAIPDGGEVLLLLDTADIHDGNGDPYARLGISAKGPDRLAVMAYDSAGIGMAASGRAILRKGVTMNSADTILCAVDMIGPFDATNPFSVTQDPPDGLKAEGSAHSSIVSCKIAGFYTNLLLPELENIMVAHDLETTDWKNFGVFTGDAGPHAFSGTYGYNAPGAWRRGGKAGDDAREGMWFTDHGFYRSSRTEGQRGFSKCVGFSTCTWGSQAPGDPAYSQPVFRSYGTANEDVPYPLHFAEIITEGASGWGVGPTSRGGGLATLHPQDIVLDKLYALSAMQPGALFSFNCGAVTLRNFVLPLPDQAQRGSLGSGTRNFLGANIESETPGQRDVENQPIVIENGTLVDLRSNGGQNTQETVVFSPSQNFPMNDVIQRNLLVYSPNFSASGAEVSTDVEPVDTTPRWTPLYAGEYLWDNTITGTNAERLAGQTPDLTWALPDSVTASFEPGIGSSAYESATGPVPHDDIQSRVRPVGRASRGAADPGGV